MKFSSDRQRKAVFASMNKFAASPYSVADRMNMGEFSSGPDVRWIKSDKGVGFTKDEKMIEDAKGFKLPEKKTYDFGPQTYDPKKDMADFIEKNKRGISLGQYATDEKQFALKSLSEIKKEYEGIWDSGTTNEVLKPVHKFLRKYSKSKRPEVRSWAQKELDSFYSDRKTEREEAMMEDPSKGTDPDWDAPDGTVFDDYNEYSKASKDVELSPLAYNYASELINEGIKRREASGDVPKELGEKFKKIDLGNGRSVYSEDPKKKKKLKSPFGYDVESGHATFVEVEVEK